MGLTLVQDVEPDELNFSSDNFPLSVLRSNTVCVKPDQLQLLTLPAPRYVRRHFKVTYRKFFCCCPWSSQALWWIMHPIKLSAVDLVWAHHRLLPSSQHLLLPRQQPQVGPSQRTPLFHHKTKIQWSGLYFALSYNTTSLFLTPVPSQLVLSDAIC